MSDTLIEVRKLTRTVDDSVRPLLNEICLAIRRGEKVGLSGLSGSGKTALMRSLAGLDPITVGEILLENAPID